MNKKTYVLGDLHGAHKAFVQVLQKANFDYDNDELICLGDFCDGWPETPECFEELLKIKNFVYLLGNHDDWALRGFAKKMGMGEYSAWMMHGGRATMEAYERVGDDMLTKHMEFLVEKGKLYFVDGEKRCYAHAGINHHWPMNAQSGDILMWTRDTFQFAFNTNEFEPKVKIHEELDDIVEEFFFGHTPVMNAPGFDHSKPIKRNNIWFMDTGSCFTGFLTLMDVDTKEIYKSDPCMHLYPDHKGRNGISYFEMMEKEDEQVE